MAKKKKKAHRVGHVASAIGSVIIDVSKECDELASMKYPSKEEKKEYKTLTAVWRTLTKAFNIAKKL